MHLKTDLVLRAVQVKCLLKNQKLITGLKNKTWTNPQIENQKTAMNSD
jgi:hypothetical protein